jgi:hypothetical protein
MYTKRKQQRKNSRSGRGKTQRGGEDPPVTNTPNKISGFPRLGSFFGSTGATVKDRLLALKDTPVGRTMEQGMNTAKENLSAATDNLSGKFEEIEKGITTRRDLPATVEALQTQVAALQTSVHDLKQVIKTLLTFDRNLINLFRIRDAFPPAIQKDVDINLQKLITELLIKYNI